jgi:hypothetical protein
MKKKWQLANIHFFVGFQKQNMSRADCARPPPSSMQECIRQIYIPKTIYDFWLYMNMKPEQFETCLKNLPKDEPWVVLRMSIWLGPAVCYGRMEHIDLLLKYGADPRAFRSLVLTHFEEHNEQHLAKFGPKSMFYVLHPLITVNTQ